MSGGVGRTAGALGAFLGALLMHLWRFSLLGMLIWLAPFETKTRLRWIKQCLRSPHRRDPAEERVAQLDGWTFQLAAANAGRARWKWVVISAAFPWIHGYLAWKQVSSRGPQLAREHGVPLVAQWLEDWTWRLRRPAAYGADRKWSGYYAYALYLESNRASGYLYVPWMSWLMGVLARRLPSLIATETSPACDTIDKLDFERCCHRAGIPAVSSLCEFFGGQEYPLQAGATVDLPAGDLFSKPIFSAGGCEAQRWRLADPDRYDNGHGLRMNGQELRAWLAEQSRAQPYLLQGTLANHPAVAKVAGETLATIRIVTMQYPDAVPRFVQSMFRIGSGGSVVDNLAQGGIACRIEADGRLSRAVFDAEGPGQRDINKHPDTGQCIVGFVLPFWSESLKLCLQAHKSFRAYPMLGWDIALMENGPLVLEANSAPDFVGMQVVAGPIGATEHIEVCLAYLAEAEQGAVAYPDRRRVPVCELGS